MAGTGINMGMAKQNNVSEILHLINQCGPISKKDIAERLGLTPAAVTLLCDSLMKSGLLKDTGIQADEPGKAGRKKVLIDINEDYGYIVGINIDSVITRISLCDVKGRKLLETEMDTVSNIRPEEFLKAVAKEAKALIKKGKIPAGKVLGAGVGVPGPVDKAEGISLKAFGVWNEAVSAGEIIGKNLNVPVCVDNNVNAFASAEILYGEGRSTADFLLVKWGPGVGSAIILNRKVYESPVGKTAELGHFVVDPQGRKCSCGRRGCLETIISTEAMNRKTSSEIELSERVFARVIVNAISLIGPEKVVFFGNEIREAGYFESLRENCLKLDPGLNEDCLIKSSILEKEEYIGPVAMFIERKVLGDGGF